MGQLSVDLSVKVAELHRSLRREERRGIAFPRYFTAKSELGQDALRRGRLGTADRHHR